MKKALIVANGNVNDKFLDEIFADYDYIVACDGGYNKLLDKKVDVLIGDLDSVDKSKIKEGQNIIKHPAEKDYTDLELSIEHVIDNGYKADIIGFYGSRIDHSLTNILLLRKFKSNIRFIDKYNTLEYRDSSFELKRSDSFFSLIPLSRIENLSIKGAKYELNGTNIELGQSLLNSNEFLSSDVTIEFDSGEMIVIKSYEK